MTTEFFIGIVPPQSYLERVEHFRQRWNVNLSVEPHITIKAQGGLTPDKQWIGKVENVCRTFKPFIVELGRPQYFNDNILYISVNAEQITSLHRKIVYEIAPSVELSKRYFELDAYVPHMTLAYSTGISANGIPHVELKEMEKLAEQELSPYPNFEVTFIRIYSREAGSSQYEKYRDIPLGQ